MKKCLFCAEEIQDAAIICRFCNSKVVIEQRPEPERHHDNGASFPTVGLLALAVIMAVFWVMFWPSDRDAPTVVKAAPTPVAATAPTLEVSDFASDSKTVIQQRCAADWPGDFRMRKYCEDKQNKSLQRLRVRTMESDDQRTIRTKCRSEWPDEYSMQNYCEETQLKALAGLGG